MQALGSLHNWLAQWISVQMPWCWNGRWEYPPIVEALSDAGLDTIGGYISQRHISAAQYISTGSIFDLAVAEERWTRLRGPFYCRNRREYGSEMRGGGVD